MPTPREVFERVDLAFLQSPNLERQYFERKEAPTREQAEKTKGDANKILDKKIGELQEKIKETICAFAVSNQEPNGGLFALGIDDDGAIRGLKHLEHRDLERLINVSQLLENVHVETKQYDCPDANSEQNFIYLLYVAFAENALPCSADKDRHVWKRLDSNTIKLPRDQIEQLKRDRGLIDFEGQLFVEFAEDELDAELAERFRQAIIENQQLPLDTPRDEILYKKGVISRKDGKYYWTRAGYLFLSINPIRHVPGAYIRLVKIEGRQALAGQRFNPSFDKDFDGPLPRQITKTRAFLRQSAFFKTYSYRNTEGSLIEESELPPEAWEEALVNAVAHRSYAIVNQPIRLIKYTDKFVVESPGSFAHPMPKSVFRITEILGELSQPRNPTLMGWLRLMKDERSEEYVKQWGEGTRTIAEAMRKAGKPEPTYRTNSVVTLTLENDLDVIEARYAAAQLPAREQFANLFPLVFFKGDVLYTPSPDELRELQRLTANAFRDALRNHDWFIDADSKGEIVAHKRQSEFNIPEIAGYVRLFPAYRFQARNYGGKLFLCIDYTVREKNVRFLPDVIRDLSAEALKNRRVIFRQGRTWHPSAGVIKEIGDEHSELWLLDDQSERRVLRERPALRVFNADILPDLNKSQHKQILLKHGIRFDLERESKQRALSLTAGASRERAEKTIQIVGLIAEELFPLSWNSIRVSLQKNATTLALPIFDVHESLEEPVVEFRDSHQTSNIADGLTRYGSVKQVGEPIQIVVVCTRDVEQKMDALIQAIQKGSRSYRGADRTFGTRFEVGKRIVVTRPEDYLAACQSVIGELEQGKRWIFLVYAPERNYSRADYDSPYYQVKRYLLEVGFPSQMVKEATVENPDWKDLNLALNIIAKTGIAPWVLSKQLAQADCFIGLSYSVIHSKHGLARLFGYANIFNSFGQWKFYKGSARDYSYDERERYTAELVKQTLTEYERTVSVQDVHIHSSVRLSRQVRDAITEAAREVRKDVTLHFVHINTTHPVRLYDQNPQGDGSLPRGTFVITSPNQFYLSTTGYNTVQKSLGTPIMIEANVKTVTANGEIPPNPEIFALHLLSLTKLNWASTRYFCHEPITTKYAGDIAYLMAAFLSGDSAQPFKLNPRLETTPWFL